MAPIQDEILPQQFFGKTVIDLSMVLCQLILVALMVLVNVSVACRLLAIDFEIGEEVAGYLLVAFTFLSLAGCAVYDAYHQVQLIIVRLPPRPRQALQLVFVSLSLASTVVLDWYLVRFVVKTYVHDNVAPTTLATPLWIPQATMPLGTILLTFALLVILCRDARHLVSIDQGARK